ncbi:glycosyltransferase [Sediminibacillus albus]|uniref:Glycosyltransferase involved in cell wall bisynthesis n=1 Tax=Sediminibacillus albus TaxID=407036 RepID=A0A1G8WG88_9BACI|nr:glycosyltransferase [Sediminibacillus albus]SDJ77282.1 Glycosyltransferase involved in cell wall bisynthesis [Sediminibacillus albus]
MKVILATPNFHQPRGNTVTVKRIADGLNKLGVNTEIVSITDDNKQTVIPKVDIVHGFHAYRFYQFMKQLKSKPETYIVTITGTDLNHYLWDTSTRPDVIASLTGAEAIHVFNDEAKETLLREVPNVKHKTYMIPQGTDDFREDGQTFDKDAGSCLFVLPAGIRKVKNVPSAIHMLRKLHEKSPHIKLWIIGPVLESDEGKIVKDLVAQNSDWVTYLGQLNHADMGAVYRKADVLLNTSHSEGQSSAILEAMAFGIPVLVAGNQGNRSIVAHRETGFIYENENQFLDYAEEIMNNNNLRQSIGQAAAQYIAEFHSSQHEAEALLKIYQQSIE